jgi:hypothetical protein
MSSREKLGDFAAWCDKTIAGYEKVQVQIFLDRLFQAFGRPGGLKEASTTLDEGVSQSP